MPLAAVPNSIVNHPIPTVTPTTPTGGAIGTITAVVTCTFSGATTAGCAVSQVQTICNDGTGSCSSGSGTCSDHGGVCRTATDADRAL